MRSSRRCGPHCQTPEHQLSLRGAQRRSNPASRQAARWIASRSLSSGAHSCDPLARNDGSRVSIRISNSRYTSTFSRRETPEACVSCPSNWREQGMPDARCTRGLACKRQKENAHEHTGSAEALRHSLRNGFTAYFALSPENRALLSPSPHGIWHPRPVGLAHLRKT